MAVKKEETRVERWDRALRNNPITAAIILLGVIVVGTSAVFRALPDGVRCSELHRFARISHAMSLMDGRMLECSIRPTTMCGRARLESRLSIKAAEAIGSIRFGLVTE
jgi:hypothetical protein